MRAYLVYFENNKKVRSLPVENIRDEKNKNAVAEKWVAAGTGRKVVKTKDNQKYVKLKSGKIVKMTKNEIEALKKQGKSVSQRFDELEARIAALEA